MGFSEQILPGENKSERNAKIDDIFSSGSYFFLNSRQYFKKKNTESFSNERIKVNFILELSLNGLLSKNNVYECYMLIFNGLVFHYDITTSFLIYTNNADFFNEIPYLEINFLTQFDKQVF